MIDPCYYLDLYNNSKPGRLPRLQNCLSIGESGDRTDCHTTTPEELFTVICTSSVCFLSSYQHGVQKLLDLAYGKEFVAVSFDESISITFYHKTKGSVTYSIAPDFFNKISNKEFYLQKKAGIPISEIPVRYVNDILKIVFSYDDNAIFSVQSVPDFKTSEIIKQLITAVLDKKSS
jgi:hypothetical protein